MPNSTYWKMLDDPSEFSEPLANLVSWSANYQDNEPFRKFLDMIGYTEENYGEFLGNWENVTKGLDYSSLDYIAEALKIYVNRLSDVFDWINKLTEAESQ